MGWITVKEPHAAPARIAALGALSSWSGVVDVDRGAGELNGVEVDGGTVAFVECVEAAINQCRLTSVEVLADPDTPVEIVQVEFAGCELNQLRVESLRNSKLVGTKLIGVDFGGARLIDVVFMDCVLLAAHFRGASMTRVQFVNCTIDEADAYGCELTDVSFDGSSLNGFNIDRAKAKRVDLRNATNLGLIGVSRLNGYLIGEEQIPSLMEILAVASGVEIEAQAER